MKKLLLLVILFTSFYSNAQPSINWQKCLGGTSSESGAYILQTTDGGYILTGVSISNNGDVSGNHGSSDVWVVKLTNLGLIQWQKCLGGTGGETGYSIQQTLDGGFIVGCGTDSNDGDVSGNHGTNNDFWVIKLSNLGIIQWQKCLGGTSNEQVQSIQQTTDGGYILTGTTSSNNGDVNGNHGGQDAWVVKLTSLGAMEWQKCLGGSGIAIGTGDDFGQSIQQTTDGGYILAGKTTSNNSDVSGNHGASDIWVVKLSSLGVIEWQKCLGGSGGEVGNSIQQTTDGGYILTGHTPSIDGNVSGNQGGVDVWVVKLTNLGIIQWQKCLGGTSGDYGYSIHQTTDGGYILTGVSISNNGDVSGNHGSSDVWIVKLSAILGLEEPLFNLTTFYPNPVTNVINIKVDSYRINQPYTIIDSQGRVVLNGELNEIDTAINVEQLSKGIYYLKTSDKNASKFIKE